MLGLTGEVEIFPKQEALDPGQKGNGINLPYHGTDRVAFGKQGEELDLAAFLALAQERQAYGLILVDRDLAAIDTKLAASASDRKDKPLPVKVIREIHAKNLASLRTAAPGTRNNTLNTVPSSLRAHLPPGRSKEQRNR